MNKNKSLSFSDELHVLGRLFSIICLALIALVPVVYCLAAGVSPDWVAVASAWSFILSYVAIGLIEAFSYAPILGVGGQYLAFITGNISNLKLPCSINAQSIAKVKQGTEEQEIVSTISIAISSIVTTIIIAIGIIPLAIFGSDIVDVLTPVSPYVIPAIFGGLGIVVISRYFKLIIIPFGILLVVCVITFAMGMDLGQSTMLSVGMVVSIICGLILYKTGKKKEAAAKNESVATVAKEENSTEEATIVNDEDEKI